MPVRVEIRKDLGSFRLEAAFEAGDWVHGILGASGCGKSMTLKCVAGVVRPDEGFIQVGDRVLFDSAAGIDLPPQRRRVGLLFQNYALFPNMTVEQNLMAALRGEKDKGAARRRCRDMLRRLELEGLEDRRPGQLSGGQQQRAALGRILVTRPDLLMLDEPFSALDSHLRDQLEREVMKLTRSFGGTTLLVSHSRDEVFRMADRVAVYHQGAIDAIGEKHQVFSQPGTYRAALLTGCKNFSAVTDLNTENGVTTFRAADWDMELTIPGTQTGTLAGFRGHHFELAEAPGENTFEMEVTEVIEDTFEYVLQVRRKGSEGASLSWMLSKDAYRALPQGSLFLRLPPEQLMLLRE